MTTATVQPKTAVPRFTPWRAVAWLIAFAAVYAGGLHLLDGRDWWAANYLVLVEINVFIIAAVSLNLINGITGQFSLGHAGFMAVGGYIAAWMTHDFHLPFALALAIGGAAAGVLGILVGLPTLRLRGDYLAIATLGMGEIVRVVFENIEHFGGASGYTGIEAPAPLFALGSTDHALWGWSVLAMFVVLVLVTQFIRSSHGRACIAVREDELAAEAMGINTTYSKILAFTLGAVCAGVAGGLLSHLICTIAPDSAGFLKSIEILVMVVLGGLGSVPGSVGAAIWLRVLNEATSDMSSWNLPAWLAYPDSLRMILYALILVVVMVARPGRLVTWWKGRKGATRAA
jgi:branched-chain amino acid transport system permease protein